MYDSILDALRRGAVAEALTAAEALAAERPDDPQALRWLSAAQLQDGKTDAALASIDRAITLAPDNADLHLARAGVLVGSRRTEEAQATLTQATGLDPNQFTAYVVQAQLALARGEVAEAERLNRLAARVAPNRSVSTAARACASTATMRSTPEPGAPHRNSGRSRTSSGTPASTGHACCAGPSKGSGRLCTWCDTARALQLSTAPAACPARSCAIPSQPSSIARPSSPGARDSSDST